MPPTNSSEQPTNPGWLKPLAVLAALAVVPGGAFLVAANIGTGGKVAIGAAVVWWLLASSLIGRFVLRARPELKRPVRGTLIAASVASVVLLVVATRDKEVDEQIATGVPVSEARGAAGGSGGGDSESKVRGASAGGGDRTAADGGQTSGAREGAGRRGATGSSARRAGISDRAARRRAERLAARRGDGERASARVRKRQNERSEPGGGGRADRPTSGPGGAGGQAGGEGQAPAAAPAPNDLPTPTPAPSQNVQLLTGSFSGASGHSGRGNAAVVQLAGSGDRVLTFSDFNVDRGAGNVRVYLAAGSPQSDGAVSDFKDIGALKGNVGDQQYSIPDGIDLARYSTVVIWCVPFTTRIAQASLR